MTTSIPGVRPFYTRPKDIGVALVVAVALVLAILLGQYVSSRTLVYQEPNSAFQLAYPARWTSGESLQEALFKIEDPATASAFKTSLTVDARDLDPSAPPTLQKLVDRRVEQRSAFTAYHFLSNKETTVAGMPAQELMYSYVVQPIDAPRRASLPVVVVARDVIVLTPTRVYYFTLVAPANELDQASPQLDRTLASVKFP